MRTLLLLLFSFALQVLPAQNLVENGSFEEYTTCPEFFGYAHYATGWLNLHTSSADYFHRCQPNHVAGVPFNTCGYQEPADGDAYMGMFTTLPGLDWYREIVGRELTVPLQPDVPVCLSFKVAVGGFGSWDGGSANLTAKGVGLRFFNGFPADWGIPADWPAFLSPNGTALSLEVVPTDTAIWYTVSGIYIPDSAYTHVAIGNFLPDSLSAITLLDSTGYGIARGSYAFVDDVRVSLDLWYCTSTGLANHPVPFASINVQPQPFVDRFHVTLGRQVHGELQWTLWDMAGRMVLSGSASIANDRFEVVTGALPPTVYAFTIQDDRGAFTPVRLISVSP